MATAAASTFAPVPDLDSEALDFRAAAELFAPAWRLAPSELSSLGLTTRHANRTVPAMGGVLHLLASKQR